MESKRLYRSAKDKVLGGVAGGIGEYAGMDPVIVRIIFVLLTIFGGGGIIIYIILWAVLPEKNLNGPKEESGYETYSNPHFVAEEMKSEAPSNAGKSLNLIAALVLIGIGVTLLLDQVFYPNFFKHAWPVILIIAGVVLLLRSGTLIKKS